MYAFRQISSRELSCLKVKAKDNLVPVNDLQRTIAIHKKNGK